jgi:hypothetical protein
MTGFGLEANFVTPPPVPTYVKVGELDYEQGNCDVLQCERCGALVVWPSVARHDEWHAELTVWVGRLIALTYRDE